MTTSRSLRRLRRANWPITSKFHHNRSRISGLLAPVWFSLPSSGEGACAVKTLLAHSREEMLLSKSSTLVNSRRRRLFVSKMVASAPRKNDDAAAAAEQPLRATIIYAKVRALSKLIAHLSVWALASRAAQVSERISQQGTWRRRRMRRNFQKSLH